MGLDLPHAMLCTKLIPPMGKCVSLQLLRAISCFRCALQVRVNDVARVICGSSRSDQRAVASLLTNSVNHLAIKLVGLRLGNRLAPIAMPSPTHLLPFSACLSCLVIELVTMDSESLIQGSQSALSSTQQLNSRKVAQSRFSWQVSLQHLQLTFFQFISTIFSSLLL